MNIAILPARSGSKRIKNKNTYVINGKPLIVHTLDIIKDSRIFDQIIVSTDSQHIADIAKKNGATIPFLRSNSLSNDTASTTSVIVDAIKKLKIKNNTKIFCIYPTAILLIKNDFMKALNVLKKNNKQFIFCASQCSSNLERSFMLSKDSRITKIMNSKLIDKNTQVSRELFEDVGFFYLGQSSTWLDYKNPIKKNSSIIKIPKIRSLDINTYEDLELAKILFKEKDKYDK